MFLTSTQIGFLLARRMLSNLRTKPDVSGKVWTRNRVRVQASIEALDFDFSWGHPRARHFKEP